MDRKRLLIARSRMTLAMIIGEPELCEAAERFPAVNEFPYVVHCLYKTRTGKSLLRNPELWRACGHTVDFHLSFTDSWKTYVDPLFGYGPEACGYLLRYPPHVDFTWLRT